jgi:hypothetical protein
MDRRPNKSDSIIRLIGTYGSTSILSYLNINGQEIGPCFSGYVGIQKCEKDVMSCFKLKVQFNTSGSGSCISKGPHGSRFATPAFFSSSSFLYCRHPHVAGLAAELSDLQAKIQPAQREVKKWREKKSANPPFFS